MELEVKNSIQFNYSVFSHTPLFSSSNKINLCMPYIYRYIPVLKAVLDVGISHHNVLEFTQSVMKQLETVTSSYYNINSEEEASLCTVWGIIAAALTICLKDQNHVNQGNEKHHDLSCFYLVVLFPFYHFYSITYKQVCSLWYFNITSSLLFFLMALQNTCHIFQYFASNSSQATLSSGIIT